MLGKVISICVQPDAMLAIVMLMVVLCTGIVAMVNARSVQMCVCFEMHITPIIIAIYRWKRWWVELHWHQFNYTCNTFTDTLVCVLYGPPSLVADTILSVRMQTPFLQV